jgi:hypothetical protein
MGAGLGLDDFEGARREVDGAGFAESGGLVVSQNADAAVEIGLAPSQGDGFARPAAGDQDELADGACPLGQGIEQRPAVGRIDVVRRESRAGQARAMEDGGHPGRRLMGGEAGERGGVPDVLAHRVRGERPGDEMIGVVLEEHGRRGFEEQAAVVREGLKGGFDPGGRRASALVQDHQAGPGAGYRRKVGAGELSDEVSVFTFGGDQVAAEVDKPAIVVALVVGPAVLAFDALELADTSHSMALPCFLMALAVLSRLLCCVTCFVVRAYDWAMTDSNNAQKPQQQQGITEQGAVKRAANRGDPPSKPGPEGQPAASPDRPGLTGECFTEALNMLARLPISDAERAEAVNRAIPVHAFPAQQGRDRHAFNLCKLIYVAHLHREHVRCVRSCGGSPSHEVTRRGIGNPVARGSSVLSSAESEPGRQDERAGSDGHYRHFHWPRQGPPDTAVSSETGSRRWR